MSLLRSAIGRVLRRLRHQQGRTLQDVADAAGVSLPYLSEIERGRKEASSEILASICRALGLALPDLLEQVRAELLRTSPVTAPVRQPRMRASGGIAALCRHRRVTHPAQWPLPARRSSRYRSGAAAVAGLGAAAVIRPAQRTDLARDGCVFARNGARKVGRARAAS